MQTDDFKPFRDGVAGVYSFYSKEVSGFALDVWWTALKIYDLAAIKDAFNRHLMNPDSGQFLPRPADIVRMLSGSTQDAALRAWATVDKTVRAVGTWEDVMFVDDPLIHRVLTEMGGWSVLGAKTDAEWPHVAREFENRYRGYRMRSEQPEYPAVLRGTYNITNTSMGQVLQAAVIVGDPASAQAFIKHASDKPLLGLSRITQRDLPLRIEDRNTDAA